MFGCENLAAFLAGPIFVKFGTRIGLRHLFITGAISHTISMVLFGFLSYVDNTLVFMILSYLLRYVNVLLSKHKYINIEWQNYLNLLKLH